jgi:hypothetical protein
MPDRLKPRPGSAEQFQILHAGLEVDPRRRQRFYRDIGQAFALRGLVLVPTIHDAAERVVRIRLFSPDGRCLDTRPLRAISWEPAEPYRIIPRALAFDPQGRAARVLFEIQHTGPGRPCWPTHCTEGHHANDFDQSTRLRPVHD